MRSWASASIVSGTGKTQRAVSVSRMGVVKKLRSGLKILGAGELTRKITVTAHVFSASALEKIQAAGGKAEVIGSAGE